MITRILWWLPFHSARGYLQYHQASDSSYRISHPDQALLWQDMVAMKMNILSRMESTPPGVRVCCAKFVAKVVQIQTPGLIADPRVREIGFSCTRKSY